MIANGEGTAKLTTYFNSQGAPIRLLFQGRCNGTLSNSVTGTSIADAPSVANIFVDLAAGTQTNIGAFFTVDRSRPGSCVFRGWPDCICRRWRTDIYCGTTFTA
jgi:hypothetical protein